MNVHFLMLKNMPTDHLLTHPHTMKGKDLQSEYLHHLSNVNEK